jgi:hypothetical protein
VFETHVVPDGGLDPLGATELRELAGTLGRLQANARTIIEVAFDASLARRAAERLDALVPPS